MSNKYLVTSLQRGALIHKNFFENTKAFCKKHKIEKVYCFVMDGRTIYEESIDPRILEDPLFEILYGHKKLNDNLMLTDTRMKAQSVNPFLGLQEKLSRNYTHIVPGAKVRLSSLPRFANHPRLLISTGAITQPHYHDHTYERPKQVGVKARAQHQQGFIYVQVLDNKRFRQLQVKANGEGNFYYKREHWKNQKVTQENLAGISFGDLHNKHTFEPALKESLKQVKDLKPAEVQLHDTFDGDSINHHNKQKMIENIRQYEKGNDVLRDEVELLHKTLKDFSREHPKVKWNIVYSNHDERLMHYINSKRWVDEPQNTLFVAQMLEDMCGDNVVPLEIALNVVGKLPKNINFFKLDEEYRIRGVLVSMHGHKGISGSRGSPTSFAKNNLVSNTGHTHSPMLHANGSVNGTMEAPQEYTRGSAGSWLYANTFIYKDGSQAISILEANFI